MNSQVSNVDFRPGGGAGYSMKRAPAAWSGGPPAFYGVRMGQLTALRGVFVRVGRATVFNVAGVLLQLLPLLLLAEPWLVFATGALTADPGTVLTAILMATCLELPLAALCTAVAWDALRALPHQVRN